MDLPTKPKQVTFIAAMVAMIAGAVFVITTSIFVSLSSGFGMGIVAAATANTILSGNSDQRKHKREVKEKKTLLIELLREIRSNAMQVNDPRVRASLQHACDLLPKVLDATEKKDAQSLLSTIAKIMAHMEDVNTVLTTYLRCQKEKLAFATNFAELMANGARALLKVDDFADATMQQLNSGDLLTFRATVSTLEPPPKLQI